ncbi:MAG: HAD family hydrolase [Mycobacteriales bacterium]
MTPVPLVALDLDRTLIYSRAAFALGPPPATEELVVVERDGAGRPMSYLTAGGVTALAALAGAATVVPTTTRGTAQYARVVVPGWTPRYAVTANGGEILVGGEPDLAWRARVRAALDTGSAPYAEVAAHVAAVAEAPWCAKFREVHGLFCYLVVDRPALPPTVSADLAAWTARRRWQVSLQGRKLYVVPQPLTKSAAVAEIAARTGATTLLAAGDSLLDAELLEAADAAVRPAHGELHDTGYYRPHLHITRTPGVHAAEELLRWLHTSATSPGLVSPRRG